ncbi:oligosaccharide repeat unit polymerase [Verrucomicrobium sp. GAS474]|uniref:O-antigen polymerase n=1 Tax=Verrucomicrobium sp. GAS474 TaxID=1882831 RepID=UPI00087CB0FE|nr:O-antigen polymerase [Verrucomicrobium sp. GAS474]SDU17873.1 oligosaccharide repeat unit polymerase [Verrucomicrobium sp. GAS474]
MEVILLGLGLAISLWTGTYDPALFQNFTTPWPDPGLATLCAVAGSALLLCPLVWVWRHRTIDFLSLLLPLEAINLFAYFAISTTANKIPKEAIGILQMVGLLLLINAIGFFVLLFAMLFFYRAAAAFHARLPDLPRPQEVLDRRMETVFRVGGCFCALLIALPMIYSGTIPLLSGRGDRLALGIIDPLRATYNFAETFFPIMVGGLSVMLYRKPRRFLGPDGLILGALLLLQILTSERSSLLFAIMATAALLSMERKWPRWLLAAFFVGYLGCFTVLAGFSALLRNNVAKLQSGDVLESSIEETFYGDNIIDLHDGAWVFSHWDFQPLMGKTYLGGMVSMVPSGLFPQKKEWHLGLNALRMVGLDTENHFGLRISFFGESFLNFGIAGVVMLAVVLGMFFGILLRLTHLAGAGGCLSGTGTSPPFQPCLWRNATYVLLVQIFKPLSNSSDAFYSWSLIGFLIVVWFAVVWPRPPRHYVMRANSGMALEMRANDGSLKSTQED